jgi:methionyl-tRNA formyltransferase
MAEPRIIFAGTPDFAAEHLQALISAKIPVAAVYTQPDRPAGRGRKLQPSPVKQLAVEQCIPVYQPLTLRQEEAQQELAQLQPDLMIVVAYGLILPQVVLDTPRLGCVNVHASLLPRWRGAAPIHRSLLAGDAKTGVTLMQMEAGLDTGPMLAKVTTPIGPQESSGELHDRLAALGSQMLVEQLPALLAGELSPQIQDDSLANYAAKLEKQEGQIDWHQSAADIARQVRGLSPWPVAFTQLDGQTIRIWMAEADSEASNGRPGSVSETSKQGIAVNCGTGRLWIKTLQLPGKKATEAAALLNSNNHPFALGTRFE